MGLHGIIYIYGNVSGYHKPRIRFEVRDIRDIHHLRCRIDVGDKESTKSSTWMLKVWELMHDATEVIPKSHLMI